MVIEELSTICIFLSRTLKPQAIKWDKVVVGPSSFFQRANTLAATVNIITKKIDGIEVSLATGTDVPYSAAMVAGKRWNSENFIPGSLTFKRKDGFDAWDGEWIVNPTTHSPIYLHPVPDCTTPLHLCAAGFRSPSAAFAAFSAPIRAF